MTIKELATRYEITESIEDIISIGSKIMTLKFGKPISKAGMPYDYNAKWLSELVEPALEKYPEMTKMWTRAYRTRVRNIIKQNKNFNAVRFFIEYLVEEHEKDLDLQEAIYNATEIEYEFDYDLEIPF
jgi:hypothetical protein